VPRKRVPRGTDREGQGEARNITFDHQDHMTKLKRGEKLRCTSCHYAIVQGEHIVKGSHTQVDTGVCFLCHFRGSARTGPGRLPGVPRDAHEGRGAQRLHVLARVVPEARRSCKQCHIRVSDGDGKVRTPIATTATSEGSRRRATFWRSPHACHLQRGPVLQVPREGPARPVELVKTFEVQCDGCHKRLHNYQKEMYMGTGRRGPRHRVTDVLGAVSCNGCHTGRSR